MPFVGRSLEPVHIRRGIIGASDVSLGGEHEALANGSLARVLRQIADLCLFADGLQRELLDESARVAARCARLSGRARDLVDRANRLNVLDEPLPECSLLDAAERGARRCSTAYRAAERQQECCLFTPDSRPPCIRSLYVRAAAPVRLRVAAACSLPPNDASLPRRQRTVGPTDAVVADAFVCWQPCFEPVVARPWPVAVGLPLQKPRRIRRRHSVGVLREPKLSTTHLLDRDAAASRSGQHSTAAADASASAGRDQQRLLPTSALIAVNTSADAFDRLAANRAISFGRAGRSLRLRRRLTLSGSPAELAGLRSHVEANLRLTTSQHAAARGVGVVSPLSRHLDLQPSTAVSSKDPDAYLTDDSSGFASLDAQQRQSQQQQRPSLFGRWLQRSRSLPRDFGRRVVSSESADTAVAAVGGSRGAAATATATGGALLDDRRRTVFVNFYGEPLPQPPAVKPHVAGNNGAPSAKQLNSVGGEQRWLQSWPEYSGEAPKHRPPARRSRSQLELPRVGSLLRSKPLPHRRSASAERPPRERSTAAAVGESFLSHTLPCLFRRKTSSDEESTAPAPRSSSTEAVVKGHTAVARYATSAATLRTSSAPAARSSRRSGASVQLPAGVVLRRRDSRAAAPRTAATSTSSGQWSISDRYSFGSDGNCSATSLNHRLCSSHASVDHDSAVCLDGGSRGDSRLGGSLELPVLPIDAMPVVPQRLPLHGQHAARCCGYCDDEKDVFDVEPLFVLQPDSEVLSLYSVDQDGFYTTMHSDSLLLENGRTDDGEAYVQPQRGKPRQVTLCDGTAQTEVTFGDESLPESRPLPIASATAAEPSHLLADADCQRSPSAHSTTACTASSYSDDRSRCDCGSSSSVQLFHSLVPVTPDASDDEREEGPSSHRPLSKRLQDPADSALSPGAESTAKWHDVVAAVPVAAPVAATITVPSTCKQANGEPWTAAGVEPHLESLDSGRKVDGAKVDILRTVKSAVGRSSTCVAATSASAAEEDSPSQSPATSAPSRDASARARPPAPPVRGRSRLSSTGSQSVVSSTASDDRSCVSSVSRLSVVSNAPSPVVPLSTDPLVAQPREERFASASDRCHPRRPAATNAPEARTPRVAVRRACDDDEEDDGTSCCGSEADAADFPRMEADSAALNIATERCLSVLAERFKIKDSSPSVSDTVSLATEDVGNGGGESLVSSLIEQARRMSFYSCGASSLDDGLGRATSQPVALATSATSRHRLSDSRNSAAGGSGSCDHNSEDTERPNRAFYHLPTGGSRSSYSLSSHVHDCFSATPNRQSGSPTAGTSWSPGDVADGDSACSGPGSSRSRYAPSTAHPLSAFDAVSGACRNVSYRIANAMQPLIDSSSVMVAHSSNGEDACGLSVPLHTKEVSATTWRTASKAELGSGYCYSVDETSAVSSASSSLLAIDPILHQPSPPPRALSYRVANDRKQLCDTSALCDAAVAPSAASPYGLASGGRMVRTSRASPSSVAAPGSGSLAGVREFMKGVYENSDQHLPPLPLAPTAVDLVPIVTATSLRPTTLDRGSKNCIGGGRGDSCSLAGAGVPPSVMPWLPMSTRPSSSTFLPGHESSAGVAVVGGPLSSAAGDEPTSGDWADEGLSHPTSLRLDVFFDGGATVPRRHGERQPPHRQLPTERPRSTVLTKGDRHELEWMQNNFASLLRRCFNDEDCYAYASMEALRQDESSLLSLIDAVQEHTTRTPAAATENTISSAATAAAAIEPAAVAPSATAAAAAARAPGVSQAATQSGGSRQIFLSVTAARSCHEARLMPTASEAASQRTHTEV